MPGRRQKKRKGSKRKKPPKHQAWHSSWVKPSGRKAPSDETLLLNWALLHPNQALIKIEGRLHSVDPSRIDEKVAQLRSEYGYPPAETKKEKK